MEQYIKPVEAVKLTDENIESVVEWMNGLGELKKDYKGRYILLNVLNEYGPSGIGDWIIKDLNGNFNSVTDYDFTKLYRPSPAKAEQEGSTQASLMLDELCELVFNDRLYGTSAGVSGRPHDPDPEISKVKRKILDLISTTPPVKEAGQPADDKTFDEDLAHEIIARFVANSGKKDSIKKIRKEAFVDGALWAKKYLESRQQPAGSAGVWIRASERLPELNKQICFRIYERRYAGIMESEGVFRANGNSCSYGVGVVEWLDESQNNKP